MGEKVGNRFEGMIVPISFLYQISAQCVIGLLLRTWLVNTKSYDSDGIEQIGFSNCI